MASSNQSSSGEKIIDEQLSAEIDLIDTAAVVDADQRYLVHPYQLFDTYLSDPVLPIGMGSGAQLVDTEGNVYLDAVGGMWCTNIGLGRDEMADAIADQVRRLAYANPFVDMTNVPAVELSKKLVSLAPESVNHVFFTTGGSTAVDSAFRTVQFYQHVRGLHEKRHIISRVDAYHGSTYASVSIGGKPGDRPPEFDFIDDFIHHLSSPNFYRYGGERTEQEFADDLVAEFEAKVDELGGPGMVAAFFAEPIMGSGGVIMPPADYLQRIWRYCKDNDIVYVSDEVVTGFGRLGEWFVSESMFGIKPDMITSAKGLTSGYLPLGALLFSDEDLRHHLGLRVGALLRRRLHLLGPSGVVRRRTQEHRDHRAGTAVGSRQEDRPLLYGTAADPGRSAHGRRRQRVTPDGLC